MGEQKKRSNKAQDNPVNTVTVGFGQSDIVQTHGEAASQILQAFSGKRFDTAGNELLHKGRSLEKISQYKVNPDYAQQNLKQQSGFSAELLEEANRNKEAILSGDSLRRRTTDGIGKTNDTKYDLVSVDESGNISDPSQMKFLGINSKGQYSVIEKLAKDKSWDRYDGAIDIPSNQYEGAKQYAQDRAKALMEQAEKLRERGQLDKAMEREELAKRYKDAGDRIRASSVSEDDAMLARQNPKKYVAKSILKDAHHAGTEAAKGAILVGGAVSLAQNLCAVCSGELDPEEAAKNVLTTTAKAGVTAYGVGSTGAALKSFMHTSKNEVIRKLGTTNLPTLAVTSTIEITSVVKSYICGEITETEALSRLGKSGTGSLAASYGAAIGTVLMPGIGTAVGSMVGYMVSSAIYDSCLQILVAADLAYDQYVETKKLCEASIAAMRQQRQEFEVQVAKFLVNRQMVINSSLRGIMDSIDSSDTQSFTNSLSALATEFGRELQFKNYNEFNNFMCNSTEALIF